MLITSKHSKTLPGRINAHQALDVCQRIHGKVSEVVSQHVDSKPQYVAMQLTLGTMQAGIDNLQLALGKRKLRSTRKLNGVGGLDGLTRNTISTRKREAHTERRGYMNRLRSMIAWRLQDHGKNPDSAEYAAADRMNEIVSKRIKNFEALSYEESGAEFRLLFTYMAPTSVQADLSLLDLSETYALLVSSDEKFQQLHDAQTELDSRREETPKIRKALIELRRITRVLLTMMHFDIANGDFTFEPVLGHVDEIIDKTRTVAERRNTLDEQEKAKSDKPSDGKDKAETPADSAADDTAASDSSTGDQASTDNDQTPTPSDVPTG